MEAILVQKYSLYTKAKRKNRNVRWVHSATKTNRKVVKHNGMEFIYTGNTIFKNATNLGRTVNPGASCTDDLWWLSKKENKMLTRKHYAEAAKKTIKKIKENEANVH